MIFSKKIAILTACIIGELLMQTACRGMFGPLVSPVIHMLFALAPGVLLLCMNSKMEPAGSFADLAAPSLTGALRKPGKIRLALYTLMMLCIAGFLNRLFGLHPVFMENPMKSGSDVIPQIMFFVTRSLSGQFPYNPITGPEWGYTLTPTYMPFQWMPYLAAQLFHFDYRWIPFTALFLGAGAFLIRNEKSRMGEPAKRLVFTIALLTIAVYYCYNYKESITTVELLAATYYLFLGLSLASRKPLVMAVALLLCLLSRYSLVLWLPLFFLVFYMQNGSRKTGLVALYVLAGFLLCYAPFLWKKPGLFIDGYNYYNSATIGEWGVKPYQPPHSYPYVLEQGTGLAVLFWRGETSDVAASVRLLRAVHLTCCLVVVALLALYFLKNRHRIPATVFLAGSLKIYLTFFYGFIQIPYTYLYILPLLFDIPVLYYALQLNTRKEEPLTNTLQTNTPKNEPFTNTFYPSNTTINERAKF